jgi:amino acid permease
MNDMNASSNVSESVFEEGALKVHKLSRYEVVATIIGSGIGSGCLGTAYASRLAGFPVIAFWLIVAAILTLFSMCYVAETVFRTKKLVQLPGLSEKYLGNAGRIWIFLAVAINATGCLIAYFNGSGRILNSLLGIPNWMGTLMFLIPAAGISWFGLKAMGMAEKFFSTGMVVLILILAFASFASGNGAVANLFESDLRYAIPVFNVAVFSYIGQYLVPDLARGMSHNPKKFVGTMYVGMALFAGLLMLIPLSVMYLQTPDEISEVATIAWGEAIGTWAFFTANIFALIAMLTSYLAISQTYLTSFIDFFHMPSDEDPKYRLPVTLFIIAIPLILVLNGLVGFVNAIYFAGAFAGAIMAILPIFMLRSARKNGDMEPVWNCGWMANPVIQGIIILLYGGTAIYAILSLMGVLPAGW